MSDATSRSIPAAFASDPTCSDMKTALALSPHLDDAIFSAGGTLARLARDKWRVVVATVFTASVPNPTGFALACQLDKGLSPAVDYMALRRDEDVAACAIIGAEPIWLSFAEAPHRGYESADMLFAGLREGDNVVDDIAPALKDLLDQQKPDLVLAPQTIGAHVDHVAVYLALKTHGCDLWFWSDFPYSIRPLTRLSPYADDMVQLERQTIDLSADEQRIKVRAMERYASQTAFQFGALDGWPQGILDESGQEVFMIKAPS